MLSIKKQLEPKSFKEIELHKSAGILDDYAVRKNIDTREISSTNGYAIIMIAGEDLIKGNIVRASRSTDGYVLKTGLNDGTDGRDQPIGISYETVLSGSSLKIIISGKAQIFNDGVQNVTTGDFIATSATVPGQALCSQVPEVPATANHFREVGHAISSRIGAGLFWGVIHFN